MKIGIHVRRSARQALPVHVSVTDPHGILDGRSGTCDSPSLASLNSAELVNVHIFISLALLLRKSNASLSDPRMPEYPADFISEG